MHRTLFSAESMVDLYLDPVHFDNQSFAKNAVCMGYAERMWALHWTGKALWNSVSMVVEYNSTMYLQFLANFASPFRIVNIPFLLVSREIRVLIDKQRTCNIIKRGPPYLAAISPANSMTTFVSISFQLLAPFTSAKHWYIDGSFCWSLFAIAIIWSRFTNLSNSAIENNST